MAGVSNPGARVVEVIGDLPALPMVVGEVLTALQSPNAGAEDIAPIIEQDAALSAKLLRLSNSAFFGYERSVGSVLQATVILGLQQVGYVTLSFSVTAELSRVAQHLDFVRFSQHSLACGIATRLLARELRLPDSDNAFVVGMLHDVGQVVLGVADPGPWAELEEAEPTVESRLDAERAIWGVDHAEAGALLAEKWGLPDDIVEDIRSHHAPVGERILRRREAVAIADFAAHKLGFPGLARHPADPNMAEAAQPHLEMIDAEVVTDSVVGASEPSEGVDA